MDNKAGVPNYSQWVALGANQHSAPSQQLTRKEILGFASGLPVPALIGLQLIDI